MFSHCYLVEDNIVASLCQEDLAALWETTELDLSDQTMATPDTVLPPGASFLEQVLARGVLWWSGVFSSVSITASFGGMA